MECRKEKIKIMIRKWRKCRRYGKERRKEKLRRMKKEKHKANKSQANGYRSDDTL